MKAISRSIDFSLFGSRGSLQIPFGYFTAIGQ
jgi:hypothetical protein